MKSILNKIFGNGIFIIILLFVSSYIYAISYENSELSPIDEFEHYMGEVINDPIFVDEYNQQIEIDELGKGDIDDLKGIISKLYILKSRYLQGPLRFFVGVFTYYSYVLLIYIILAFSELIYKKESKIKITSICQIMTPFWFVIIFENFIMAIYIFMTKQLIEYCLPVYAIIILITNMAPFLLVIREKRKRKEHFLLLGISSFLIIGFNIYIAILSQSL